mmetsp:Transcript_6936/g.9000  ORF Transcript_6936/g.9000 Transcript_6936/m.9000 type:complete len:409 (+) Transcript_6936:54-1280(+)
MPFYLKQGNSYRVRPNESMVFEETLPAGTYAVKWSCAEQSFVMEIIDNMSLPPKLYGNMEKNADRILRTFGDRPSGTGVLLAGNKGSGKTLLAKLISAKALSAGIPTLVINTNECAGDAFNTFVQMIEQPAVLLFDEFEKVYSDGDRQSEMLTLLDGLYPSKKLFLLTCNDRYSLNENMIDRPGRLFYLLEFEGVGLDFVRGYCEDNLKENRYISQVCSIAGLFSQFNFDILKALVEEMNRYNESPTEAIKFLNARPDFGETGPYHVELYDSGVELEPNKNSFEKLYRGNIFTSAINMAYYIKKPKDNKADGKEEDDDDDDDNEKRVDVKFSGSDLVKANTKDGIYEYLNEAKGAKLVLTRRRKGGAMDLDRFCSIDTPMSDVMTHSGSDGAGQVMDFARIDDDGGDY